VSPGGSYASHSDTEVILGLGTARRIDALTIRWPWKAAPSELGSLEAGHRYHIEFGGGIVADERLVGP
jgi:hypothetical protein